MVSRDQSRVYPMGLHHDEKSNVIGSPGSGVVQAFPHKFQDQKDRANQVDNANRILGLTEGGMGNEAVCDRSIINSDTQYTHDSEQNEAGTPLAHCESTSLPGHSSHDRELPLERPLTPNTQIYAFSSDHVDEIDLRIADSNVNDDRDLTGDTAVDFREDLAGLTINDLGDYCATTWYDTSQNVGPLLVEIPTAYDVGTVFYLWFSEPDSNQQLSSNVGPEQFDTHMDKNLRIDLWMLICLAADRVWNVTFATGMYVHSYKVLGRKISLSADLTDESRKYWFESRSLNLLDTSQPGSDSQTNIENLQEDFIEEVESDSVKQGHPECHSNITLFTLEESPSYATTRQHPCIVYGCIKRFDNHRSLDNHLAFDSHDFRCSEFSCRSYTFENHAIFKNHIFIQHPEHEWRLFRPLQEQARMNHTFEGIKFHEHSVHWKPHRLMASASQKFSRRRTMGY